MRKKIFNFLLTGLLLSPTLASCTPKIDDSSSTNTGDTGNSGSSSVLHDDQKVKYTISFNTTLLDSLSDNYSLAVVTSLNDYSLSDKLVLSSDDSISFNGSTVYEVNKDIKELSYKYVVLDNQTMLSLGKDYESEEIKLSLSSDTLTTNDKDLNLNIPSVNESFTIVSIYDETNEEDITSNFKKNITFLDKEGIERDDSYFKVGLQMTLKVSMPRNMDGRNIITSGAIGVNAATSKPLEFKSEGEAKTLTYTSTFTKTEKDTRIKLNIASEYLVGVASESVNYLDNLFIGEDTYSPSQLASQAVYIKGGTKVNMTFKTGFSSLQVYGVKLNSPDSYSFDSGVLVFNKYSTNLSPNDQTITVVEKSASASQNIALQKAYYTTTWNWNKSEYTSPDAMFDGTYTKGFDSWNDYFAPDKGDYWVNLNFNSLSLVNIKTVKIYWYVATNDAELPTSIKFQYKLVNDDSYIDVEAASIITQNNVTTITLKSDEGLKDITDYKLLFNGNEDKWANISEFEIWS